jgi:putative restriction endonuclease
MNEILDFIRHPEWDVPFFKRLAHNDTGAAAGHQGGMVLPKDLRQFLPALSDSQTNAANPTADRFLRAEMYSDTTFVADSTIRYQIQTWGGTRTPESRITDGLSPIRISAQANDLLLFQRRADALDRFRLVLVKQGSKAFRTLSPYVSNRRWGPLFSLELPMVQSEFAHAQTEVSALSTKPFTLIDPSIPRIESRRQLVARGAAFRAMVRAEYSLRCAVTGIMIQTPKGLPEVESAHVVPRTSGGPDDVRNGMAMTQTVHWAFDRGLLGIAADRTVHVPQRVKTMPQNKFLAQYNGRSILEARSRSMRVHADALAWHRENKVRQWE